MEIITLLKKAIRGLSLRRVLVYATVILGFLLLVYYLIWSMKNTFHRLPWTQTYGAPLTEKTIRFLVPEKNNCTCAPKANTLYHLKDYLPANDSAAAKERRKKEYNHYTKSAQHHIILAPENSPLRYPIYGVQVMPLKTIRLPGLQISASLKNEVVTLEASLGTFDTEVNDLDVPQCQISGRKQKVLYITTSDTAALNHILNATTYTSTIYSIDSVDFVKFSMGQYLALIPISIRQPPMVLLHDPGKEHKISSLVTITTKTFLRYQRVRDMIKSIHLYYPDIKVIVADDSDVPEKIEGPNVEHYIMPYAKGWFAGRNLAVSQVSTKYFLWVDDDFLFTNETKLEKLVEVLERTDLDMVGGSVAGNHFSFKLHLEKGGDDGDCLHWIAGGYHQIEGFPNCVLTSGVVNFFLAHTQKVLAVGFDPRLNRIAHTEFFVDGLGRLKVGSCSHVTIGHQQKKAPEEEKGKKQYERYLKFRSGNEEGTIFKHRLMYFKNRLRCFAKP